MNKQTRISAPEALIEAAFTVFSRDPSAPLSAVADTAGVGRATLHRHFAGRENLINRLARIAIAEMEEAAEAACVDAKTAADALQMSLHALIPLADRHGFLAHVSLDGDAEIQAEFDRQQRETEELVEEAQNEGTFDPTVATAWIVQAYEFLLYAGWETVRTQQATPKQAADLAWTTLTVGLGGRA